MQQCDYITLLLQVGISLYFMMKMHGQTILKCFNAVSFVVPNT